MEYRRASGRLGGKGQEGCRGTGLRGFWVAKPVSHGGAVCWYVF